MDGLVSLPDVTGFPPHFNYGYKALLRNSERWEGNILVTVIHMY